MEQVICRYKGGKQNFEIICNAGSIKPYREGKAKLDDVVVTKEIFFDVKKGTRPKESDLTNSFDTKDIDECLDIIIKKGDYQVSTNERKEQVEQKKAQMIEYVHKNFIDPTTKKPHPITRIENAFSQIKALNINPDTSAEKQVNDLLPKLKDIIMLVKNEMEGYLTIPNKHVGKCQGIIKKYATIVEEKYNAENAMFKIGFLPCDLDAFMSSLNTITHGEHNFEDPSQGAKDIKNMSNKAGKGGNKKGKKK